MRLVVGAHVQAEGELAGHLGQPVLLGVGVEAADGESHGPAGRVVLFPELVEAEGKIACGKHGVAAKASRQTDMRVFANDLDLRVAEVARHPGADGNRYAGLHQLRSLLDVQLDERLDRFGIEAGRSLAHGVEVGATFGHVLAEGATRTRAWLRGPLPATRRRP